MPRPFQLAPMVLQKIPDGEKGTDAVLYKMRDLIISGSQNPLVRQFTANLVQDIRPQKSRDRELSRVFYFVRDDVSYIPDILDLETLHGAEYILVNKYGDCDDKTVLLLAMLRAIGFETEIVAIGGRRGCEHVFGAALLGESVVYMDPTEPVSPGWYPPGRWPIVKRLRVN